MVSGGHRTSEDIVRRNLLGMIICQSGHLVLHVRFHGRVVPKRDDILFTGVDNLPRVLQIILDGGRWPLQ